MTEEPETIDAQEAQQALDTIKDAKRTGIGSTIPPRWLHNALAISGGLLVASATSGNSELNTLAMAGVWGSIVVYGLISRTSKKGYPSSIKGTFALLGSSAKSIFTVLGVVSFLVLLVAGSRFVIEKYDMTWIPLVTGTSTTLILYLLGVSYRRHHANKSDHRGL